MAAKCIWQLQPLYSQRKAFAALAEREGAAYEVSELSAPPVLGQEENHPAIMAWYGESRRVRSLHGAFIDVNPASGDRQIAELSRRRCTESCRLAVQLGAENVVFHSSAFPFLRGGYLENWAAASADFFGQLAAQFPLNIYLENSQDIDPTPLERLMAQLESAGNVGVCLDIGHANYSSAPMSEWFDRLGGRIGYLHLSDNRGRFDDHLPLGEGSVDWQLVDRLACGLDRELTVTLETGSCPDTEASLHYLRKMGYLGLGE